MKARILSFLSVTVLFAVIFSSCKKESSSTTDYTTEASAQSEDQSRFTSEVDGVANDASAALESSPAFAGRNTDQNSALICNATVVRDSLSNPRTITITYNGASCFGNTSRTGVVILSMPGDTHWKNAGAAITVTYQNLKITRLSDNKSITINGSHVLTNVSGGLLINLATLTSITHSITSTNMSVTFDDGTQRTWQVAKQRVFTYNNGVVITTTGTHIDGALTGIAEWGTNRLGHTFTTAFVQPLVIRQDCNFRLVSGKVEHHMALVNSSATFGLDASGNPTSCPGTGSYYMKIEWTGANGNSHSSILPY